MPETQFEPKVSEILKINSDSHQQFRNMLEITDDNLSIISSDRSVTKNSSDVHQLLMKNSSTIDRISQKMEELKIGKNSFCISDTDSETELIRSKSKEGKFMNESIVESTDDDDEAPLPDLESKKAGQVS